MKKRVVAGALAGILSVSAVLGGCGGGSNEGAGSEEGKKPAGDTITLLSWYSEEYMGEFMDAFKEETGIEVDLQYVPPVQQYVDKFSVLVASGQMTDMFFTAAENKQEVVDRNLAEDISDMKIFSKINPNASATYGAEDAIFAYSPDAWVGGVFYNKDLFEQAGVSEPKTWDEFVSVCKTFRDMGIEPYVDDSENVHNIPADLFFSSVISQDPDADRKINAGEKTFEELYTDAYTTWYKDLVEPGLYSQISLGLNGDQTIEMFATGQAAMIHGGPWTISTIVQKNPELKFDIFGISDKDGNCVLPGAVNVGLSISTSSEKKEQCRQFIEFMAREENILKWQKVTGNSIIVEGVDYEMGNVMDKFKDLAVNGDFYLGQIVWDNSAGIFKELLVAVQDCLTGSDTIENVPKRLDAKMAELNANR